MKRSLISALVLGAVLVGCERTEAPEPATEEEGADEDAPRLTPVDEPAASEEPVLGAISRVDLEAELEAGAGCHVEQDGKNLLTAVEGDAIAKPYGTLRHFEFASGGEETGLDALWAGGLFTAGAITIAVTPADGEGEQIGEVTVREAEIVFSEEGQPATLTLAATWQCGS